MILGTKRLESGCEAVYDENGVTINKYCKQHYQDFIEKLEQYAALLREEEYTLV